MKVTEITINKIKVKENIRVNEKEGIASLMESIRQNGLKEPIGVMKDKHDYILLYGYRRLMAYKKLGYKIIPAVVETGLDKTDIIITNAIENIQRLDISPIELGRICRKLSSLGLSLEEIASRLGIPQVRVMKSISMYRIPQKHQKRIKYMEGSASKKGAISASLAYDILSLKKRYGIDAATTELLFDIARKEALTVNDMRMISLLIDKGASPKDAIKDRDNYIIHQIDVLLNKKEVEDTSKKTNLTIAEMLRKIIFGELPPFSKTVIRLSKGE